MADTACIIDGCTRDVFARGYCNSHYLRLRRHGDPFGGAGPKLRDVDEKFRTRTTRQGDCLIWTGATKSSGYGKIYANGKHVPAHRWAYERFVGPIPEGHDIDHTCHNRLCCEPTHLRPATRKQNNENHQGATSASTTGIRGVYWIERTGKYQAEVKHNGRKHHGGFFDSITEAETAVIELRNRLFTHNDRDRRTPHESGTPEGPLMKEATSGAAV